MLSEDDKAAAERVILNYLSERNAWEREVWPRRTAGRTDEAKADTRARIRDEYSELIRRHCAPRVVALGLHPAYGSPPTVDPEGTRIVSITRHRGSIRVLTEEDTHDGLGSTAYEYELVDNDGQLKLSERRGRVSGFRAIRDVW